MCSTSISTCVSFVARAVAHVPYVRAMSPYGARGMSFWYALLVNAGTRRLVLAYTPRRLAPAAAATTPTVAYISPARYISPSRGTERYQEMNGFLSKESLATSSSQGYCSPFHSLSSVIYPLEEVGRSSQGSWQISHQHRRRQGHEQLAPVMTSRRSLSGWARRTARTRIRLSFSTRPSRSRADVLRCTGGEPVAVVGPDRGIGTDGGDRAESSSSTSTSGRVATMKITLLSGFLGAGKTTLMRNVLRQAREEQLSLAVIVNDMADVNIDAQLLSREGHDTGTVEGEGRNGNMAGLDTTSVGSDRSGDSGLQVAMQDGCICCTLRDELLQEVEAIARAGKHQHLIIESTGISDPTPVAEALATSDSSTDIYADDSSTEEGVVGENGGVMMAGSEGKGLEGAADGRGGEGDEEGGGIYTLDTLVTVVDSTTFLNEVRKADDLEERGLEAQEGDTRTVADLLVSQVEFANIILLNKADMAGEAEMGTLEALVRRLNPVARIVRTISSDVGLADVLGTGTFDLEAASRAAGWVQALEEDSEHISPHQRDNGSDQDHNDDDYSDDQGHDENSFRHKYDESQPQDISHADERRNRHRREHSESRHAGTFGIGSFTFRARRPLHPERLMDFVMTHLPSVLRSKGFLWLATRHDTAGIWNQSGGSFATEYGGLWDDDGDLDEFQSESKGLLDQTQGKIDPATSDNGANGVHHDEANTSRNELVFIGLAMDEENLKRELQRCLLTDDEMAEGPASWAATMSDPFPPWKEEDVEEQGEIVLDSL